MAKNAGSVGLTQKVPAIKKVTSIGKGNFSRPGKKKSKKQNGVKAYRGQGK